MKLEKNLQTPTTSSRTGYLIRRCFAFAFDWYICAVLSNLFVYYFDQLVTGLISFQITLVLSVLLISTLYFVLFPLAFWKGQTIMQRAMQLKVVQDNGSDITLQIMVKRFFIGCLCIEGAFYSASTITRNVLLITLFPNFAIQLDLVFGSIFAVLAIASLYVSFRDKNTSKLYHDVLSKTKVIDVARIS